MTDFEERFKKLQQEQKSLDDRLEENKREAIEHIQKIVDCFGIKSTDIQFYDQDIPAVTKSGRTPAKVKYRLPNGVEWTGKGIMKKEVKAFLDENGLTKEDLEQYKI